MSEDLIRRSDAIGACAYETFECYEARKAIRNLPSADRPQGEWIDKGEYAECSNCGANSGTQFDGVEPVPCKTRFCPNCGARMKGADDECEKEYRELGLYELRELRQTEEGTDDE